MNVLYGSSSAQCPLLWLLATDKTERQNIYPAFQKRVILKQIGSKSQERNSCPEKKESFETPFRTGCRSCRPVSSKAVQWQTRKREAIKYAVELHWEQSTFAAVLQRSSYLRACVSSLAYMSLSKPGHYMYRTVVTIYTAQRSLYVPHSGHYMYRTVVTICTAQRSLYVPHSGHYMYHQFSIQQFYVQPTKCMCFLWIWEQTAVISLYSINWLVSITETSVFTARYGPGVYNSDPFTAW